MYKIRSRFYKKDDMVFISHLDLIRVFERAIRRAKIPVAYTQGFNPHPIMAFASALGIGISSNGEYMDMEMEEKIEPDLYMKRMNEALPKGIGLIQSIPVQKSEKSLMSVIKRSIYLVKIPFKENVSSIKVKEEMNQFLEKDVITEVKELKKKKYGKKNSAKSTEKNIRNFIIDMSIFENKDRELILKMILSAGSTENLKPETVVKKLGELTLLPIEENGIRIHRTELLMEKEEKFVTPIEGAEKIY